MVVYLYVFCIQSLPHKLKSYMKSSLPNLSLPPQCRGLNTSYRTSLVAQTVKHLSTMWETQVQSLDWEDPLEKEMAIHSSTIAWKIPWTEEPGRLQSMGSQSRTRLNDFTKQPEGKALVPMMAAESKRRKTDSSCLGKAE